MRAATKLTDMTAQVRALGDERARGRVVEEPGRRDDRRRAAQADRLPAGKKYPLLVVIHGGPTGVSRPTPFSSTGIYPIDIWTAKGALVLEPNYRGSAGYGEAFRSLNVRNLGVGDAWDVLSGIDYLIKEGLADPDQVGTMGWSQGGYISAFLTTHDSARFKAVSVGAGISDWMTYYVNTDITPVHAALPEGDAVGRSRDLREDLADHLHQEREDADADPARRHRPARAAAQRLRALSRPAGRRRAVEADRLQGLRRRRPRPVEAEVEPRGDAAQPRLVRQIHLRGAVTRRPALVASGRRL